MTEITNLETRSIDEINQQLFALTDELRCRGCSAIPAHITDSDIIREVNDRTLDLDDVFPGHECQDHCGCYDDGISEDPETVEEALQDEHHLRSGGPLFGIQLAYEHACAGNAEDAAQALKEAVPALPNIRHQRQMPAPPPATTPASSCEIEIATRMAFPAA